MTKDDKKLIVHWYIRNASPKSVREDTNIQAGGGAIQDFLLDVADFLDDEIEGGFF